ncbi:MAG: hypothetical protein H6595_08855 [Flavobacteriales bacterium]|nr:hypothetical protein [Flavobacteriales bacterium]MCB9167576.1 hypothetical protein [Flavobacteriales bacterium]
MLRELDPAATSYPFELWREEGILRLLLTRHARIGPPEAKELVRLIAALDPATSAPILLELGELVQVGPVAKELLSRLHGEPRRAVALLALDTSDRLQGEFFRRFHKPAFPFRVFVDPGEAHRWLTTWARSPGLRVV